MKVIIYDIETKKVIFRREQIASPSVTSDGIEFAGGGMTGISAGFILVDDAVEVGDTVTDDIILADRKPDHQSDDIESLKSQLADTNADLLGLMEFVFGGSN
jgi:hypothetical protein